MNQVNSKNIMQYIAADEALHNSFLLYTVMTWARMCRTVLNNRLQVGVWKTGRAINVGEFNIKLHNLL